MEEMKVFFILFYQSESLLDWLDNFFFRFVLLLARLAGGWLRGWCFI